MKHKTSLIMLDALIHSHIGNINSCLERIKTESIGEEIKNDYLKQIISDCETSRLLCRRVLITINVYLDENENK